MLTPRFSLQVQSFRIVFLVIVNIMLRERVDKKTEMSGFYSVCKRKLGGIIIKSNLLVLFEGTMFWLMVGI